jgi:hypothetical protein
VAFLVSSGLGRHSGRRSAIAGAVVAGECLVFAANGLRCPLTDLAESWGAERRKITDSYLPSRFAHALPAIHAPVLILVLGLHRRRLYRWAQSNASWRGRRRSRTWWVPAPGYRPYDSYWWRWARDPTG